MVARSLWRQGNRKLVACKLAAHTPGVWPDYLSQLHHWLASNSQSSDRSTGPATRIVLEEEVKRSSRPGIAFPALRTRALIGCSRQDQMALDVAARSTLRDCKRLARVSAADRDGCAVAFGRDEQIAVLYARGGQGAGGEP